MAPDRRILITGAAGLVGQNLAVLLARQGYTGLVGFDKHPANTATLRRLHPAMRVVETDLAARGDWAADFTGGGTLVLGHAQIGGTDAAAFHANNVTATENVLDAAREAGIDHIVHISSSVVNSQANDLYADTKRAQEALVRSSGIPHVILRPTLMFGWFDRKHLGWLARFMRRSPVFPVPGDGRFRRQPLYAGDFCAIIAACIARRAAGEAHNISGLATIDYLDLIRAVREACGGRAAIVRIPFALFDALLGAYALIDRDPPFTRRQLAALAIPELFEVIDWPALFGVAETPLPEALHRTFREEPWCRVTLEF